MYPNTKGCKLHDVRQNPTHTSTPDFLEIPFYEAAKLSNASKYLSVQAIYDLIKSDTLKADTEYIQSKHKDGILDGFKTVQKHEYQKDKKRLLNGVCFTGYNRADGTGKHTGLINIDCDGNGKKKQLEVFEAVKRMPYCHGAFFSVSGVHTGDFSANFKIEIPKDLSDKETEKLHKRYFAGFEYLFIKELDYEIGKSKDLKRVRYLSHDPNLFVNPNPQTFTLQHLEHWEKELQKHEVKSLEKHTINIKTDVWQKYCEAYAKNKGYKFVDGQKNDFCFNFSVCANLLGVSENETYNYLHNRYDLPPTYDRFLTPFKSYHDSHGQWNWKLKANKFLKEDFLLEVDKYISDQKTEIDKLIEKFNRLILQSGCGSGKTYFIIDHAKRTGKRLLLTVPYTALTKQIRQNYDVLCIDGQSTKEDKQRAQTEKIVVCTYDQLHILAPNFDKESDLLVVDEFHNLTNQKGFRGEATTNVFEVLKAFKHSVLLSGTPNLLFKEIGYKHLKINQKQANKVTVNVLRYKSNKKDYILKEIEKTPDGKLSVIRCNTIKELKQFKETLINLGTPKEAIAAIYEHDFLESDKNYQSLIDSNKLPENIRFLLCTAKINDGVNVENINIDQVFVYDVFCKDTFVQFVARFRNIKHLKVNLLHSTTENWKPQRISEHKQFLNFKEYYQAEKIIFEQTAFLNGLNEIPEHLRNRETPHTNFIDTNTGEMLFLNVLYEIKQEYEKATTKAQFYSDLSEFSHIEVKEDAEIKTSESKVLKQVKAEIKESSKGAEVEIKEALTNNHFEFFKMLFFVTKHRQLKKTLEQFFLKSNYVTGNGKSLLDKYEKLLRQHDKLVYKYASMYLFLDEHFNLDHNECIRLTFEIKKHKQFKTQVKCAKLIELHKQGKLKGTLKKDTEMLLQDIRVLRNSEDMFSYEAAKVLNTLKSRYFRALKLDSKQASERVQTLFLNAQVKQKMQGEKRLKYIKNISLELTLKNVLNYYNINELQCTAQNDIDYKNVTLSDDIILTIQS